MGKRQGIPWASRQSIAGLNNINFIKDGCLKIQSGKPEFCKAFNGNLVGKYYIFHIAISIGSAIKETVPFVTVFYELFWVLVI